LFNAKKDKSTERTRTQLNTARSTPIYMRKHKEQGMRERKLWLSTHSYKNHKTIFSFSSSCRAAHNFTEIREEKEDTMEMNKREIFEQRG